MCIRDSIPAFRWYDKDAQKLFVSGHDAPLINARYARGEGFVAANGDAFGFLERVAGCESQILAMRGFDVMDLLRGADPRGRDPLEARVICRLV